MRNSLEFALTARNRRVYDRVESTMFPRGVTSSPLPKSAYHRQTPPHLRPANNMGPPKERKVILEKLRKSIKDGKILVGAGAGIGLSAKFIEKGGGDMIIIYNSGRFRMAGRGSLAGLMPYGNANDVVLEMGRFHFHTLVFTSLIRYRRTKFYLS